MILLIRHCTPDIRYSSCSYAEAAAAIMEYNNTKNLKLDEIAPVKTYIEKFITKKMRLKILSSPSPRSLITAQKIFDEMLPSITVSSRFIEFDLSIMYIPVLRFKFGMWLLISRIIWLVGLLKTRRSFCQEVMRAKLCASFLYEKSKDVSVVLVAHGLLNCFIEQYLKFKGYHRTGQIKCGSCTAVILEN